MHRLLGAEFAAERDIGGVGDHLVDVHVGLGAGAGLPDQQREMLVELAVGDVLRHRDDRLGAPGVERAEIAVDLGGRALDQAERAHDFDRHAFAADAEIMQRALGLRAPELVGGDIERPEGVAFDAGLLAGSCRASWPWPNVSPPPDRRKDANARLFLLAEAVEADHFAAACRACRVPARPAPPRLLAAQPAARTRARRRAGAALTRFFLAGLSWHCALAGDCRSSPSVTSSNCRPNCTDGSKKPLIASNGMPSFSGMPPNDRPTSKPRSLTVEIPELVLQDDGHLLGILHAQPVRHPHALGLWCRT